MFSTNAKWTLKVIVTILYIALICIVFWQEPLLILAFIGAYFFILEYVQKFIKNRNKAMEEKRMLLLLNIKEKATTLLKALQEEKQPENDIVEAVELDRSNNSSLLDARQRIVTDDAVNEILKIYYQIDLFKAESYDDFLNLMQMNKSNLKDVPAQYRDEKLCLEAMKTGSALSDVPEILINEALCREYIGFYPWNFYEVPEEYLTRELCFSWVNMINLGAIPSKFRDREMCLEAMSEDYQLMGTYDFDDNSPFDYIPEVLKEDELIIERAKHIGWIQ
ncbi:hypothetical protein [Litorilituus lipolyticus]|uniref:Uncharacterized protein n=1 Tax=Litorilituus lipolyticus TaxID=2491017 RepID=A0A502KVR9_9GAMM|nr:hypothetical protein [Litorilituus lipolyticus]TPH15860.1 hypothetical protein EPA86_07785 [Litorilituus lipolyticus]